MKPMAIALKDLTQSFRSAFALMFMFVLPLLVTGIFYLMFGNQSTQPDASLPMEAAKVVVVNLDQDDEDLARGMAAVNVPGRQALDASTLGDLLLATLQDPSMAEFLTVSSASSVEDAREMVDQQVADLALMIPPDFSSNYSDAQNVAEVTLDSGKDPSLGGTMASAIIERLLTNFAGTRIASVVAVAQLPAGQDALTSAGNAALLYTQSMAALQDPASVIDLRAPQGTEQTADTESSPLATVVGPIMAGMLIMFAFFTGASTAQSILKESEEGTLARMFTTATRPSLILVGKFLSVGMTVLVQVVVLLLASHWIFAIQWGRLMAVAMTALGMIACATALGILLASLMKTTRQGGAVFGGLLTVTGMIGMLPVFTGGNGASAMNTVSLIMPQGWAVRSLMMSMQGADLSQIAINLLVLLALSVLFMAAGVWKFQKRFAF